MKALLHHPDLFRWNRSRFMRQMLDASVAVFCSNDEQHAGGSFEVRFRQNPDLFYLTGITQPDTVLVLAPNTARSGFEQVLFIRRSDHPELYCHGSALSKSEASGISGIDKICYLDELDGVLHSLIISSSRIYINAREDAGSFSEAASRDLRFAERLMKMYPAHKYHRAQPILKQIAMVKTAPELGVLRRGVDLAANALQAVVHELKPAVFEYQLEAAATAAIIAGGAEGLAHPVRIASGSNSLYACYDANADTIDDQSPVQVQVGVRVAGYHVSVARIIPPLDRGFDDLQRDLYQAVLESLQFGIEQLLPGGTLPDCEKLVREELIRRCDSFGIDAPRAGWHFSEQVFHHLGRNLEDPYDPYTPLQSSMVLTCAPAIYLHEQGYGMQLRSVILITDEGPVDLTAAIPTSLEDVEKLSFQSL